jgi:hypothetical protein
MDAGVRILLTCKTAFKKLAIHERASIVRKGEKHEKIIYANDRWVLPFGYDNGLRARGHKKIFIMQALWYG